MGVISINSKTTLSFWDILKTSIIEKKENELTAKMVIEHHHRRDIAIVHGGATCALIDFAVKNLLNGQSKGENLNITFNKISFLKPGKGDYLIAKATIQFNDSKRKSITCSVYDSDNACIAIGSAVAENVLAHSDKKHNNPFFEFTEQDLKQLLPEHVITNDRGFPFTNFLGVKRTLWKSRISEMEVKIEPRLREPDGTNPHSLLTMLTDMACGQAVKTILPENAIAFTIELSSNSLANFNNAEKLIARARVINEGRVVNIQSIIFDEQGFCVGEGSSTYYVKYLK